MARGVARLGDTTIHDGFPGRIFEGSENTLCNGRRIARVGDKAFCTNPNHSPIQSIKTGSKNTLVNGRGMARNFDRLTCGAIINSASKNTFCN